VKDFYRQFVNPGDLVFDVGANIGQRTKVFLDLAATVIAVEPIPGSVAELKKIDNPCLTIIQKAVGSKECAYAMGTDSTNPVTGTSTASLDWIRAVKKSNRFGGRDNWDKIERVQMTTLNLLIRSFGAPAFIKIDVEGFEYEALMGLNFTPRALCFEFVRERAFDATACIGMCVKLGLRKFNLSFMETFELGEWTDVEGILERMIAYPDDGISYGDIYARS
jgi:FkbM family methyltransferase